MSLLLIHNLGIYKFHNLCLVGEKHLTYTHSHYVLYSCIFYLLEAFIVVFFYWRSHSRIIQSIRQIWLHFEEKYHRAIKWVRCRTSLHLPLWKAHRDMRNLTMMALHKDSNLNPLLTLIKSFLIFVIFSFLHLWFWSKFTYKQEQAKTKSLHH